MYIYIKYMPTYIYVCILTYCNIYNIYFIPLLSLITETKRPIKIISSL